MVKKDEVSLSDFGLLLSVLYMSEGKIEGRKHFQKKVCVLKYKYDIPFSYKFTPYHYGPFSESLAVAVDTLVGLGYIDEEKQKPYNNFMQYTYRLTPEWKNFALKQIEKMKKESLNVYSILSSKMNELNKMDTTELVKLSKEATKNMYQ